MFQILGFKNNISYQTGHAEIKNEQANREILVLLVFASSRLEVSDEVKL